MTVIELILLAVVLLLAHLGVVGLVFGLLVATVVAIAIRLVRGERA